jgi:hypothetical protein
MPRIERLAMAAALATLAAMPASAQQAGPGAVLDSATARAQAAVDSTAARAARQDSMAEAAQQRPDVVVEQAPDLPPADPGLPPPRPLPQGPPISADEVRLVFDREIYRYDAAGRRDPFKPLTGTNAGPLFEELTLRMILHSDVPGQSIVVLSDGSKRVYRLRRGESVGNITVVRIDPARVVFSVVDFGVGRQEMLSLKNENETEGA